MMASLAEQVWRPITAAVVVLSVCTATVQAEERPAASLNPEWAAAGEERVHFTGGDQDVSEAVKLAESANHEVTRAREEGRVSVLVHMEPTLGRHALKRGDIRRFATRHGGKVKYEYHSILPHVLNLRGIPESQIESLKKMPGVTRVEVDEYHPNVINLHDSTPLIRALQSQITGAGLSADGSGVRVCVCDTGIDSDHIMYSDRIDTAAGYDFYNDDSNPEDDHGHGTHCSGIAVGGTGISWDPCGTGSEPFQGVAPEATLIGVKILNQFGGGYDSDIIAGIDYCADQKPSGGRADVISLSIGTGNYSGPCSHSWAVAANNAVANGVVVVAASGNNNYSNSMSSPACGIDVIAVGATYKADYPTCEDNTSTFNWSNCTDYSPVVEDQVVCFSNESDYLDVTAPGAVIWSASNSAGGSSIVGMSGTSMACPHVAGLAALILDADPTLTPAEVRQIIRDGAIDFGPTGFDRGYGYGRVDAINSLQLVGPGCTSPADCDDGLWCNGAEDCVGGSCVAGTPPNCNDSVACTDDSCNEATDSCDNIPNDANCDNGLWCDGAETCNATLGCQAGTAPDCNDGVACTDDSCNESTDSCDNVANDANCDNGLYCDGAETCDSVLDCQAGTAVDCNDGVGCTDDSCNESTDSCDNVANDANCDDGLWCNGAETCDPALDCQAGSDPCPGQLCDEDGDFCYDCEFNSDCDDGLFCNGAETCVDGTCQPGTAVDCNDGVGCTDDSCNETTDSCDNVANDANCDDGQYCNGAEWCDAVNDCQAGTAVDCNDGVACTVDACNETTDSCDNTPDDGLCDDGQFCNGAETCDPLLGCQAGTDPCPGLDCDEVNDQCTGGPTAQLEADWVTVGGTAVTVPLSNTYVSPVVVCSVQYSNNTVPVVPRVTNVGASSFDVYLQNPAGGGVAAETVHYLVVEEGNWTIDGVNVEAQSYLSTVTDENNSWVGEAQSYLQSYTSPVVLGQVMSTNDAEWSVFWCQGTARANPPVATDLKTGKTVCEDTLVTRADETVGFIVFEAGHGTIGGIAFEAALGADTVAGVTNAPPYTYTYNTAFASAPQVAITTMAGVDGGNGGWSYTYGASPTTTTTLDLVIDEDQIADTERNHTTEQVGYVVFETALVYPSAPECTTPADCDDGLWCNGAEDCVSGSCVAGTPVDCSDGVVCTDDSCNESTDSCDNIANDANCADGLYCNGDEWCDALSDCQAGTAVDCNDGVACTDDSCNETTDSCDNVANDAYCDNGEFCDGAETCDALLGCQAGIDPCVGFFGCDEVNDVCVECSDNADCDDGLYCNGAETCDALGVCQPGSAVDCSDGVGCTDDSCNETTDSCDNVANDANCDDGQYCNGVEWCDAVSDCQAGTAVDCNDGVGCTDDSCNESTDSCDNIANDANCDDGQYCNGAEWCDAVNDCQAGTAVDCNDGVGCTDDSCNESTDSCDNIANDAYCPDNGLFCDGTEYCDAINDCSSTGDPCATGETCNETTDTCESSCVPRWGSCSQDSDCCSGNCLRWGFCW